MPDELYYRYRGSWSEYNGHEIYLETYPLHSRTPKGVWLRTHYSQDKYKFCLNEADRRFAYPTIKLAKRSFLIRQKRRAQHARNSLETAEALLALPSEAYPQNAGENFRIGCEALEPSSMGFTFR